MHPEFKIMQIETPKAEHLWRLVSFNGKAWRAWWVICRVLLTRCCGPQGGMFSQQHVGFCSDSFHAEHKQELRLDK